MDDHPRKTNMRSQSPVRKPSPFPIVVITVLSIVLVVSIICAFMVGVGGRAAYEMFKFGWDLFSY